MKGLTLGDDEVRATNSHFDVEDLFRLRKMAFIVEIALAKARKGDSKIQIKDKQDLFHTLTDKDTFTKILKQAAWKYADNNTGSVKLDNEVICISGTK